MFKLFHFLPSRIFTFFMLIWFLFTNCESSNNLYVAEVDTDELTKELKVDNGYYKAIFIFEPSCTCCFFYLEDAFSVMKAKFLDSIEYFFISVDTIELDKYKIYFNNIGIRTGKLFSLRSVELENSYLHRLNNISDVLNYCFPDYKIQFQGFPISCIVNQENKIKLEYSRSIDSSTKAIKPLPWHRFYSTSLFETDFNKIDTEAIELQ